jgi:hypothetical protein
VHHLAALFLFDLNIHTYFAVNILAGVIREIVVQALLVVEKLKNLLEQNRILILGLVGRILNGE